MADAIFPNIAAIEEDEEFQRAAREEIKALLDRFSEIVRFESASPLAIISTYKGKPKGLLITPSKVGGNARCEIVKVALVGDLRWNVLDPQTKGDE